ncbi:MAG: hypothetical protein WCO51_06040 [bacterium]|jgi:hypothetical protein
MQENLESYLNAARRGSDWLVDHQGPDGLITSMEACYKSAYALAVSGRFVEANLLVSYIKNNALMPNGDFGNQMWRIYKNAWIVQGAHRIGRFDVSMPGMSYILNAQAPCGGFCGTDDTNQMVECVYTAWSGLAAVYLGQMDVAKKAGDCFLEMLKQQPDKMKLYFNMSPDGKLLTDSGFIDATLTKQIYYNPGIVMLFFMRLYIATLDKRYLSGAQQLFEFSLCCAEDAYQSPPSGKSGLGAAIMYSVTGDERARDKAIELADYLVGFQHPGGSWGFTPEDPLDVLTDITGEFTVFLTEIAATLASVK